MDSTGLLAPQPRERSFWHFWRSGGPGKMPYQDKGSGPKISKIDKIDKIAKIDKMSILTVFIRDKFYKFFWPGGHSVL